MDNLSQKQINLIERVNEQLQGANMVDVFHLAITMIVMGIQNETSKPEQQQSLLEAVVDDLRIALARKERLNG